MRSLVDSGATDNFVHPHFIRRMGLGMRELATPKKLFNIDDTMNRAGMITHYVDLDVYTNGIHKEMRFLVSNIGKEDALLGYPWLATFKPKFSWKHGTIHTSYLPIILSSTNPHQRHDNVVAALRIEEKEAVVFALDAMPDLGVLCL
jgi:hypothetical protein